MQCITLKLDNQMQYVLYMYLSLEIKLEHRTQFSDNYFYYKFSLAHLIFCILLGDFVISGKRKY